MVERQLPKLHTRVRFPSPAFLLLVQQKKSVAPEGRHGDRRRTDRPELEATARRSWRLTQTPYKNRVNARSYLPPKSLRNDRKKRPGKVAAFC